MKGNKVDFLRQSFGRKLIRNDNKRSNCIDRLVTLHGHASQIYAANDDLTQQFYVHNIPPPHQSQLPKLPAKRNIAQTNSLSNPIVWFLLVSIECNRPKQLVCMRIDYHAIQLDFFKVNFYLSLILPSICRLRN